MKRLLMTLPFVLLAGAATAMEKHMSMDMTCAEVKASLQSEGKAEMMWPSKKVEGMTRYGTYVAGRQMCMVAQCSQYGRSVGKY
jgi:hypothetical protein